MGKLNKEGIKVNYARAVELARAAVAMKQAREPPFDREDIFPDSVVPKGMTQGSLEHRQYLFHSISLDSMKQAEQVYIAMHTLAGYLGRDFSRLREIGRSELEKVLYPFFGNTVKGGVPSTTNPVGTLLINAHLLDRDCGGDPANILKEGNVMATIGEIDKFRQYGIPKAALLMKNYVRFGIWDFPETHIPIKIDRHLLRISLGCGVVDPWNYQARVDWAGKVSIALRNAREQLIRMGHYREEDFTEERVRVVRGDRFVQPLTTLFRRVTMKEGISAIDLDDAKWAIGAYLCKRNDGVYCATSCGLGCSTRYPSDNNACWFFLDVDKRKDAVNLFNWRDKN